MNDTMQKNGSSGKGALTSGPVIAAVVFCLAYGSVMALVIAPRSLLTSGSGSDSPQMTEDSLARTGIVRTGAAPNTAGAYEPRLLNAGFRPAEASLYGITD